MSKQRWP